MKLQACKKKAKTSLDTFETCTKSRNLNSVVWFGNFNKLGPSQPGTIHLLIGKFSYFLIRFLYYIFFVFNFSYLVIRFLLNSSMVKSNNEIGKVDDKKNLIQKSNNEIGKF